MQLVPIPQSNVVASSPIWGPFVERIAGRMRDHPENLFRQVLSGEVHILIAWDEAEHSAIALCGTRIVVRGDERVAEVVWLTGRGRETWLPLFPEMERYFREHQLCAGMKALARPGWTNDLEAAGYKRTHILFEKDFR